MKSRTRRIAIAAAAAVVIAVLLLIPTGNSHDRSFVGMGGKIEVRSGAEIAPGGAVVICERPGLAGTCQPVAEKDAHIRNIELSLGSPFRESISSLANHTSITLCFFTEPNFRGTSIGLPPGGAFDDLSKRERHGVKIDNAISSFKNCHDSRSSGDSGSPESGTIPEDQIPQHPSSDGVAECPENTICLWSGNGFTGEKQSLVYQYRESGGGKVNLTDITYPSGSSLNDNVRSLVNNLGNDCIFLERDVNPGKPLGTRISGGEKVSSLDPVYSAIIAFTDKSPFCSGSDRQAVADSEN
ncbi:peptidase inhibitor family I36 protein [Streptomyces sp. NPDC026665]|uniref:peptidase inhibitor family I36 protein n=1 Tax=Streptomyces sp. NPDC026665 TaxID=3154798 RepID=UPI0033D4ABD7